MRLSEDERREAALVEMAPSRAELSSAILRGIALDCAPAAAGRHVLTNTRADLVTIALTPQDSPKTPLVCNPLLRVMRGESEKHARASMAWSVRSVLDWILAAHSTATSVRMRIKYTNGKRAFISRAFVKSGFAPVLNYEAPEADVYEYVYLQMRGPAAPRPARGFTDPAWARSRSWPGVLDVPCRIVSVPRPRGRGIGDRASALAYRPLSIGTDATLSHYVALEPLLVNWCPFVRGRWLDAAVARMLLDLRHSGARAVGVFLDAGASDADDQTLVRATLVKAGFGGLVTVGTASGRSGELLLLVLAGENPAPTAPVTHAQLERAADHVQSTDVAWARVAAAYEAFWKGTQFPIK
jgi:hypothetical protein